MSDPAISLDTLFDQATSALKAGQVEIAIRDYERILQQAPEDTPTLNNLAIALKRVGRLEAAIRHYKTLIRLQPDAISYYNLGNAYHEHGQLAAAIAAFQQSLTLGPQPNTYVNLGISLYDAGDPAGAIGAYHQALQLDPHSGHAHTNLGLALLMQGDWQAGWEEWRWQAERTLLPNLPHPHWQGDDLRDKTLLLHTEGGFGDTLQFIRYAELLVNQGATVGVMCPPALHRLLQAMPAITWVVAPKMAYPPVDAHALLLSVPKYLGTTLETLPATIPYLTSPISKPALTPAPGTRLKVGVTWASGAYQGVFLQLFQQRKTCPLGVFADLFSLPDVSFYSLQVGQDPEELAELRQSQVWGDRLFDLHPEIRDFADTAAWVEHLDLVISVDTSVVHLAGALGKPTWVLLPYMCDWRWGRDRTDTPWYPNLRLFRQPQPGDWCSVISAVKAALQQWSPVPPPANPSRGAIPPSPSLPS
ncbi:tetratricopeptide repeat protein, partial [Trichothermofontia sp.]